jgi:hypothetical protein
MLKNELDALRISHNIVVAFEYLTLNDQNRFLLGLRLIEKDCCALARQRVSANRKKEEE